MQKLIQSMSKSLKVLIVTTSVQTSRSIVSWLLNSYFFFFKKSYIPPKYVAQSKHSYSKREKWGTVRRGGIEARLKLSRANIKSYSLMSGVQVMWCPDELQCPGIAVSSRPCHWQFTWLLSWDGYLLPLMFPQTNIRCSWHLQHPGLPLKPKLCPQGLVRHPLRGLSQRLRPRTIQS